MDRDIDPLQLLAIWWKAESEWSPVDGYPRECPSCAGYRASRQWDGENGADEASAHGMLIRHIGEVIHGIDEPYRTALYLVARNHATGRQVWRSARLPESQEARMVVVSDAVQMFVERL